MHQPNVKEIEEDLDENFRPVLRRHKKKGEMSWWGWVNKILDMDIQLNTVFFKVSSKWMECCICIQYHENGGTPWLSCSFERENHCHWGYIIGDYTHCAPMLLCHKQVSTNVKDNDESNVLFMWRKKRMKGNECQCFSFGCFHFLFL